MRVLNERTVLRLLEEAGFAQARIDHEDVPEYGLFHSEPWSLPIVAPRLT